MSMRQPTSVTRRNIILRTLGDIPRIVSIMINEGQEMGPRRALEYTYDHLVRLLTGAPPERYSRITDAIHVGGQYTAGGFRRLQARGVSAVINLRDEFDNQEAGIAPPRYLYLPTVDNTPPRMEDICAGIRMIREEVARGGQVYVHCMLGVGRSATLAAAYLVTEGQSAEEAWQTIRQRRPFIRPTGEQVALVAQFAQDPSVCREI